jgi:adenine phosphoribosyltransferase
MGDDAGWLKEHIRDVPNFPKPGIDFKDLTPLLSDGPAFGATIDALVAPYGDHAIDKVLGVEARGFIFGSPVAERLGAGFVPVRKAGKLPWCVEQEAYALEYGTDLLEIHCDAVQAGQRVLIVDDVLATGGTAAATVRLVHKLGGDVVGLGFIIELAFLGGRSRLEGHDILALITYD